MCNNIYIQEKALEEQQRSRVQEIENRRNVVLATGRRDDIRHLIGCCGRFLVMLGTRLEQAERHEIPARA